MSGVEFKTGLVVHSSGDNLYYVDFTDDARLYADTIASVTSVTCSDATMTVGTKTVLTSATTVPYNGSTRIIAANKGISVRLSGGTAIEPETDPARLTVICATAGGYKVDGVGLIRVED